MLYGLLFIVSALTTLNRCIFGSFSCSLAVHISGSIYLPEGLTAAFPLMRPGLIIGLHLRAYPPLSKLKSFPYFFPLLFPLHISVLFHVILYAKKKSPYIKAFRHFYSM